MLFSTFYIHLPVLLEDEGKGLIVVEPLAVLALVVPLKLLQVIEG
jgi:hypothetical protein